MAEEAEEVEFDPHAARVVHAPMSDTRTFIHFLKGSIGTGILAMPLAFSKTGMIIGTFTILTIGLLASYGINMLVKTEYELCKRKKTGYLSYAKAMRVAIESGPYHMRHLAQCAEIIVDIFLVAYQLGICCIYVVFVANNVKSVVDGSYCDLFDVRVYMMFFLVPFMLINAVPNLKLFAPLSAVANVLMFIGLGIIFYFVFDGFTGDLFEKRDQIGGFKDLVLYVGIALFALESVGVICAAEHEMKNPSHFVGFFGILNISVLITIALYWFVGIFGFLKYGSEAKGSITLNLPEGNPLSQATQILFAISLIISYGLQCYPAIELIWDYILPRVENASDKKKLLYEYILRESIVIFTFCVALGAANHLGDIIGFLGAMCLSMLGFSFPALMHLFTFWPDKFGKFRWMLFKDIFLIILGIVILFVGVYATIDDIINSSPKKGCGDVPNNGTEATR